MTAVSVVWDPDLGALAGRYEEAGGDLDALVHDETASLADSVRATVVPIMADFTPKRSGKLAGSTAGDVALEDDGFTIRIRQPALSDDGQPYVQWVVEGRGDVYPVNKKALASKDGSFGPVKHAGPAAANDYPARALEAMDGPVTHLLTTASETIYARVVAVLE